MTASQGSADAAGNAAVARPATVDRRPAPRVLMVDQSDRGGIARYTARLVDALRDEGLDVRLAAPAPVGDDELVLPATSWGPHVSGLGRLAIYRLRLRELGPSALALVRAVRRSHPDVVHLQSEVLPRLDPLALRWVRRRAAVVVTAHDPVPLEGGHGAVVRQARRWRAADAVVIHAEESRRLVEANAGGARVRVVPVDLALGGRPVPREDARRSLGLDGGPVALLLGLIRQYKGVGLLAEAWPTVAASVPGARLMLVGQVYPGTDLRRLAPLAGVHLLDAFVPDDDLDRWAAAADVVLLPYEHGSHSGILHRAIAQGTPVLASPSLAEEVERTGAGRVVPLRADAWADELTRCLSGDSPPAPTVRDGRQTARQTVALYEELLRDREVHRRRRVQPPAGPARIVYYLEGAEFGGVERHLLGLLTHLDRSRFEPIVAGVMVEETADAVRDLGVALRPLPYVPSKVHVARWVQVTRGVRQTHPDIFHAMLSQSYAAQYALLAAMAARVPAVVVTAHLPTAPSGGVQAWLRRVLVRGIDVQVVAGEWTRAELTRLGQLAKRIEVIPNSIDVPAFRPRDEARRMLGIDPHATVVGASMRLVDFKRGDLLVELARRLEGVEVVVLGDGPNRDALEVAGRGLPLRLCGFRPDAAELLRAFDVFVHPSPTDNQPLAVLEAMAAGIPTVVADAGGAADMIVDGRTGLHSPPTGDALAQAVARLLGDPALGARLVAAAADDVGRHSARSMAAAHEALYDRLLGRTG